MHKKIQIRNSTAEFLIFTNQTKDEGIEVRIQNDTIWLSQKLMAALFDCSTDNIGLHLKNIFSEGELDENSTTELFSVVASNQKTYKTKHYNIGGDGQIDVCSHRGTGLQSRNHGASNRD